MRNKQILILIAILTFCYPMYAYAYVDPSVMSYTVQTVAGTLIALGAVVGIIWRRVKRKAKKSLGLNDENNKEIDEDIIIKGLDVDEK